MGNCFKSRQNRNENDNDVGLLREHSSSAHNVVQGHTGPAAYAESTGSIPQAVSLQTISPATQATQRQSAEGRPTRARGPRGNSLPGASDASQV